jgi:hypothetical protein
MKSYIQWLIEQIQNGSFNKEDEFVKQVQIRAKEQKEEDELTKNKVCPNCNRLRLYYRATFKSFRCSKCKSLFCIDMKYLGIDG